MLASEAKSSREDRDMVLNFCCVMPRWTFQWLIVPNLKCFRYSAEHGSKNTGARRRTVLLRGK